MNSPLSGKAVGFYVAVILTAFYLSSCKQSVARGEKQILAPVRVSTGSVTRVSDNICILVSSFLAAVFRFRGK